MGNKKNVDVKDLLEKQENAIHARVVDIIKQAKLDCLENIICANEYDEKLKAVIDMFDDLMMDFDPDVENEDKEWQFEYK